jgi:hypothetical protein
MRKGRLFARGALVVLLACVSLTVACRSPDVQPSAATMTTVSPAALAASLGLGEQDTAILAKIDQILTGLGDGSIVVQGWAALPLDMPLVLEEFIASTQVRVYIESSAGVATSLYEYIVSKPQVRTCTFISKQQAFERMKEEYLDHPEVVENLTANPLPDVFEVTLASYEEVKPFVADLETRPEVDAVHPVATGTDNLAMVLGDLQVKTRPR